MAIRRGTNGNNTLNGTNADDVLFGRGGNDVLNARAGADRLLGGSGHDVLNGDEDEDRLVGGGGNDQLFGGGGDDTLLGGGGHDTLSGDVGVDTLRAGGGNDILVFDRVDLQIDGGPGRDTLLVATHGATLGPANLAAVTSIEIVDLRGAGANTLVVDSALIARLSDTDVLRVRADAEDTVFANGDWLAGPDIVIGGATYAQYVGDDATLQLESIISGVVSGVFPLSSLNGSNGFRLDGVPPEFSGSSVESAGDINDDGYSDLIIGATGGPPGGPVTGAGYVVFGKSAEFPASLQLESLDGDDGFRIDGVAAFDGTGVSVSSAGDINGDGFDDVLIGAGGVNSNGPKSGATYVVFGHGGDFGTPFELASLDGNSGFRLDGGAPYDYTGGAVIGGGPGSVSAAGDFNGDGFADVIVGASRADPAGPSSGSSYIVFGKSSGFAATMDLAGLDGDDGFRLEGVAESDLSGLSVGAAGDINGDGFDDVIIGAPFADPNGGQSGASYVVFGRNGGFAPTVDLDGLDGITGFRLDGANANEYSGRSVGTAGDVNGDGFDDLIIGADYAQPNGLNSGSTYVVFGHGEPFDATLTLSSLDGMTGFRLDGAAAFDTSGYSVGAAGDLDGDGFDDLLVAAPGTDHARERSGSTYVLFGRGHGFDAAMNLEDLNGETGLRFDGVEFNEAVGNQVRAAGDVDGDGFDDVIIGAPGADSNGVFSGASYVVFGTDFRGAVGLLGTDADDVLMGSAAGESIVGGRGNDQLDGGGGADVLIGGAGDDTLLWDPSDRRIDGGGGFDTLKVSTAGADFANGPDVRDIEAVDLRGGASSTLVLDAPAVRDVTDTPHWLQVSGDPGDVVNLLGAWTPGGTVVPGFTRYDSGAVAVDLADGLSLINGGKFTLSSLDGMLGFRIDGAAFFDQVGFRVSGAGDINGDGYDDVIVGGPADPNGDNSGSSYVVFGQAAGFPPVINVASLDGTNGFRLDGVAADDNSFIVSAAGDVNADGFGDLIIGGPGADSNGEDSGSAYVVFGHGGAFGATFALASLDGASGFRLDSAFPDELAGEVSNAGDVNGDGFDDLLVASYGVAPGGPASVSAYVVFGQAGGFTSTMNLANLDGATGFRLHDIVTSPYGSGARVSTAGDVNGDGFADIVIGAAGASPNGAYSGSTYVVLGHGGTFAPALALDSLDGTDGFRLDGTAGSDYSGRSVSAAGDVNGDGFGDLILGAPYADPNGDSSGSSYVVFGRAGGFYPAFDLANLDGSNGFRLDGRQEGDKSGRSVSGAGDVNGDGYDDLLVGADGSGVNGMPPREAYVVFGRGGGFAPTLDLADLDGERGFRLEGPARRLGVSVSAAGDVDGDGYDDIVIGDSGGDQNALNTGSSYVLFGRDFTGTVGFEGGDADDLLTGTADDEALVGGRGDDTLDGAGGADVLNGGAGDDVLTWRDGMRLLDGGHGTDTARFGGIASFVDLTGNTGLRSIEIVDLTGGANNGLRITPLAMFNLSDANTLRVDGDAGDFVVTAPGDWVLEPGAPLAIDGQAYHQYSAGIATLLIDTDVTVFRGEATPASAGTSQTGGGIVNGTGGNDVLNGNANPNTLRGRGGNDRLNGNGGNDRLLGGDDEDLLIGAGGHDRLNGDAGDDRLVGGGGNDRLFGGDGDDRLEGGNGRDTLDGEGGADILMAGGGNDLLVYDVRDTIVDGGTGIDTLRVTGSGHTLGAAGLAAGTSIEIVDLRGTGANALVVDAALVTQLSDTDVLRVRAGADDTVLANGMWESGADIVVGAVTYAQFLENGVTLQVQSTARTFVNGAASLTDLDGTNGFRIDDFAPGDYNGQALGAAGDVNGDGFDDFIVGAYGVNLNGLNNPGVTYVIFGQGAVPGPTFDVETLDGTNGFRLDGIAMNDRSGKGVSGAGDVNGDGYDDVIVGASGADPNGSNSGSSYVVYGKAESFAPTMGFGSLDGDNGFRLDGVAMSDLSGYAVSAAGDVNGDGIDDFLIGARSAPATGVGSTYVVFGQQDGFASTLALTDLDGVSGFRLDGAGGNGWSGHAVSAAGDVNGDGFGDIVIGAPTSAFAGHNAGAAYLVFGKGTAFDPVVDMASLDGASGFRLDGAGAVDFSGRSVSGAGDVNGDGFDDFLVGADGADSNGENSGSGYLVFGKSGGFAPDFSLGSLDGMNGFSLTGGAEGNAAGYAVSGAGDVNGDGFDDVLIGARTAESNGAAAGSTYLVFGRAGGFGSTIDLGSMDGSEGLRFDGIAPFDLSGNVVSAAGDIDGDGFDDFLIGAKDSRSVVLAERVFAGSTSVIHGRDFTGSVAYQGGDTDDVLTGFGGAESLVGGRGNDWLDGGAGSDVLIGGAGDDWLVWDATDRRIDGGGGFDTLKVTTSSANFTAGADVRDVEAVDMTGGVRSTTTLDVRAVRELTGSPHRLLVTGDVDDVLNLVGPWANTGEVAAGFTRYVAGAAAVDVAHAVGVLSGGVMSLADVDGVSGFRIDGAAAGDRSGVSVSAAGDVNGDGFGDVLVGATGASPNGAFSGSSYVVFGHGNGFDAAVSVTSLDGSTGFRLDGAGASDLSGRAVAAAGDVNGDGVDDLIVGAPQANPNGGDSGSSYVVFGQAGNFAAAIALADLDGSDGFRLDGAVANDFSGRAVGSAGDVNGDGFDDLLIGAYGSNAGGKDAGSTYVVFGHGGNFDPAVGLASLDGVTGFRLDGEAVDDESGFDVSGAGDVNGDGFDDLLIGAWGADSNGPNAGSSYVVFGHAGPFASVLALGRLDGTDGFRLDGEAATASGYDVGAAGDINGDGFDDVIIGARGSDPHGTNSGSSYVVFGGAGGFAAARSLAALDGTDGFRLDGVAAYDYSGRGVSGAGDVNGDGFDDLIVGAFRADPNGESSGSSYVVFGKGAGFDAVLDLADLDGSDGFRLDGEAAGDLGGLSVSAAGDIDGDGFDDLVIGASGAGPGGPDSGASYVLFGRDFTGTVARQGGDDNDVLIGSEVDEGIIGGRGDDVLDGMGGADVLKGGAGDDTLLWHAEARLIEGGGGMDTLRVIGSDVILDFTQIPQHRVTGIEVIDLTGNGNNLLELGLADVLDLSDHGVLRVDGDAGDVILALGEGWIADPAGPIETGGQMYSGYTLAGATLLADVELSQFIT